MHRSEEREYLRCVSCDAEVSTEDRVFMISDDDGLCFDCAVQRGGAYDELHDRWTTEPDVTGVAAPDA